MAMVPASNEADIFSVSCPSRDVLDLIADKWSVLIIGGIRAGANRNGLLLRAIDGISQRMLTRALRQLERNGLVTRTAHAEVPPRVTYALSELGASLAPVLQSLCDWSIEHMREIRDIRAVNDHADAP